LKIELQTLIGIDAVEVTREVLHPITGGVGSGVNIKLPLLDQMFAATCLCFKF
jgi:hypothetical protein